MAHMWSVRSTVVDKAQAHHVGPCRASHLEDAFEVNLRHGKREESSDIACN